MLRRALLWLLTIVWPLLLRRLVHDRGFAVRGHGWRGYYIGQPGNGRDVFATVVDSAFTATRRRVDADFGLPARRIANVRLVCYADPDGRQQATKDFGQTVLRDKDFGLPGLYVEVLRTIVVFDNPSALGFRNTLVHELAHAFCDELLGDPLRSEPAWASEGYAHFVTGACCEDPNASERWHLDHFSRCYRLGRAGSLRELLFTVRSPNKLDECLHMQTHAAVFVRFLHSFRQRRPQVWTVLREVLAGHTRSSEEVVGMFERAFGTSIEKIELQFLGFCIDEGRRLKSNSADHSGRPPATFFSSNQN